MSSPHPTIPAVNPSAPPGPNIWPKFTVPLLLLTAGGWAAILFYPGLLVTVGILRFDTPFLDSYAILAAVDAVRAGADPHMVNPLDPLLRGHVYSDWWLALQHLGLTRQNNVLMATIWVAAFGLTALATTKVRSWGETIWIFLILISPSVLLAVNRANNDLVIFILLAGCCLPAATQRWWKNGIAVACLALAAGLKYFPAAGVLSFLWIRPVRRMPAMLLAGLVSVAVVIKMVADEIDRGRFFVPSGLHTMGGALMLRDFGCKDNELALPSLMAVAVASVVLAATRLTTGLVSRGDAADRMRAALGSVVLLACFLSGVSYAYRWIFVIWPAIWLWRQAQDDLIPLGARRMAGLACGLIFAAVWFDGLLCVLANLVFPPMTGREMQHLLVIWRHWTQPISWLLMMFLGGWLAEGAWITIREWWSARHEA